MAKASIHIIAVKLNSEIHNQRLKEYDYVRQDLTHTNENWIGEELSDARTRIKNTYEFFTGQKMQKKATPIREGVLNLNAEHTMEDLHKLKDELYQRFKIKTIQMYIHRDEGYQKSKKEWKQNLHAHLVFDWTDEKGKTLKLNSQDMSELQDLISNSLAMERGVKSNKKHLSAIGFKVKKIEENIEQLKQKVLEYVNLTTPSNIEEYKKKTILGLKLDEKKVEELLVSEKSKASVISNLKQNNSLLQRKTEEIISDFDKKKEELIKLQENLIKKENDLNRLKNDYLKKSEYLAHQQQELSKLSQLKADFKTLSDEYEKIKHLKGIDYSKKFIEESIWVRLDVEKQVSKQIMQELQKETFRNRQELYATFCERMEKSGFFEFVGKELGDENPFFKIWEEEMNFQYRGRGMRL